MAVIAFAALVVVSDNAFTFDHISQAIFEWVFGWWHRLRNTPDHHLGKCVQGQNDASANQRRSFHAGIVSISCDVVN